MDFRSISGFAFSLGSTTITWSNKKQSTMALLSTEAEYRGVIVAMCEAIWLQWLLRDLHVEVADLIPIYCDDVSSMHLEKNLMFHARTKHIELLSLRTRGSPKL